MSIVVNGGFLLLAELNCTACHVDARFMAGAAQGEAWAGFERVGSRLDADTLWLMIRSPQHREKGHADARALCW
jgi:hypothetical protein